jgi:hypothetical protein
MTSTVFSNTFPAISAKCRMTSGSAYVLTLKLITLMFVEKLNNLQSGAFPKAGAVNQRLVAQTEGKRLLQQQEPHGVLSQKTAFFIVKVVKTSNLT